MKRNILYVVLILLVVVGGVQLRCKQKSPKYIPAVSVPVSGSEINDHCRDTIPPEYNILYCKETGQYAAEYVFSEYTKLLVYDDPSDAYYIKDYVQLSEHGEASLFTDSCSVKLLIYRHWSQVLADRKTRKKSVPKYRPSINEKCFNPIQAKRQ